MFIATIALPIPRSVRSETRLTLGNPIALLTERRVKKGPPGYKHLAPTGRSDQKAPLHSQVESVNHQWKMRTIEFLVAE